MKYAGVVNAPEFPADAEWLNTDRPLSIRQLRGKVVLLDFWTYCCINCMHILPDLKKLEEKYADELVVIGVHSAKFTTERGTENIREAILRYEIDHPVVNDSRFRVWSEYGARAWPTLVLINPLGKVIGSTSGEGIYEPLDRVIGELVQEFDAKGAIDRTPSARVKERDKRPASLLAYPGKIIADDRGERLFFTDSNHNRIVVIAPDGTVLDVVGSGRAGAEDGAFGEASFSRPQGLAYDPRSNVLYVADTENHLIRRADLTTRTVSTLAGTGEQARRYNAEGRGTSVALNSPWDLALHGDRLYIAMAGSHQVWMLDLATLDARVYAGSGREDKIDGPLKSAALAQPSGIAVDGSRLSIADSEVSAVRTLDLAPGGAVKTLIGKGLFEFGDIDGAFAEARLQHPLGVAVHEGVVYIADTYNHKIKRMDPAKGTVRTVVGSGKAGHRDGDALSAQLFEPSGLTIVGDRMYIADTNNNVLRIVDMATWTVSTLQLSAVGKLAAGVGIGTPSVAVRGPELRIAPDAPALELDIVLPEGMKLNDDAPFLLAAEADNSEVVRFVVGTASVPATAVLLPMMTAAGATTAEFRLSLYYCSTGNEALCWFRDVVVRTPVVVEQGGTDRPVLALDVRGSEVVAR